MPDDSSDHVVLAFPGFEHLAPSVESERPKQKASASTPRLASTALVATMEDLIYELVDDESDRVTMLLQLSLIERAYLKNLDEEGP